ncbi:MAG: hypothetical protein LBQ24_07185 [Candidatus Peribacteria bacterium]|nr:hypothetical protein [Candidatus Peribacteria bacterium]
MNFLICFILLHQIDCAYKLIQLFFIIKLFATYIVLITEKLVRSTNVFQETIIKKSLKKLTISSILFFISQISVGTKSVA